MVSSCSSTVCRDTNLPHFAFFMKSPSDPSLAFRTDFSEINTGNDFPPSQLYNLMSLRHVAPQQQRIFSFKIMIIVRSIMSAAVLDFLTLVWNEMFVSAIHTHPEKLLSVFEAVCFFVHLCVKQFLRDGLGKVTVLGLWVTTANWLSRSILSESATIWMPGWCQHIPPHSLFLSAGKMVRKAVCCGVANWTGCMHFKMDVDRAHSPPKSNNFPGRNPAIPV